MVYIERNNTWKLVKLPTNTKFIEVKWGYKLKHNPDDSISKYKFRLVVIGFMQRAGLDYSEVYDPIARLETVKLIVVLCYKRNWSTFYLDVKYAFLMDYWINRFMLLNLRICENMKGYMVYRLHKAPYGLKQTSRVWNKKIDSYLVELGFI